MKISTLVLILVFACFGKLVAQPSCIFLGCASNYGTITANTSGPDINDPNLGCYGPYNYKQVYWEYFYAPTSANFTQTFHQTSTGAPININFLVFDIGTAVPSLSCPVDATGWPGVLCETTDHGSADVGPGLNGDVVTTAAGHFYAIAIILWDGTDPSYTFTIGTPQLGGVDLTSNNCTNFPPGPPSCIALGCAANFGSITVNTSGPDRNDPNLGCYGPYFYKQIYWEFFFATTGSEFTQTFHQTSTGSGMNLNYLIFDMGTTPPQPIRCPIDASSWPTIVCETLDHGSADVGPGLNGDNFFTTAGHYYAIAIIFWDGTDPSYTFTIGTPQLGGVDLDVSNCAGVALPVKLISFNAQVSHCTVDLTWKVASETNFSHYEVQYSTNSGASFETIASLPGDQSTRTYSYQHMNPAQGKVYYRLKMVDIDGKFDYSKTLALNLNCDQNEVLVYPNPVTDLLNINVANADGKPITCILFDANGKMMYTGKLASGTNTVDMSKFPKGIYLLSLKNTDTEIKNMKIIK